jgi:predicted O-linked N-acetylglucosamine transferase (SPINDLY family)
MQALGRFDDAAESYRRALALDSHYAPAHYNLGNILMVLKRYEEAAESYRRALEIKPDYAEAHHNLGAALHALDRCAEAILSVHQALMIQPNFAEAWCSLGGMMLRIERFGDAHTAFRQSLAADPMSKAWAGLGYAQMRMGNGPESVLSFRHALEMDPTNIEVHSNYIYSLDFIPEPGFAEHQAERKRWYEYHGRKFASAIKPHKNDRSPDRKLRIGYVSADFNHHSPSLAFGPVMRHHDRSQFELFLYSGVLIEGKETEFFREMATVWCDTKDLSDDTLAQRIRDDRIDILVDLAGQSLGNRLLVLARKPAPVQVTAWGYATGTGVPTIDYLFADPVSIPESARPHFAEAIYDLPCILGHVVPDYAPDVGPLPCAGGAPVTFGCLNRLNKITAGVVRVWGRLLREMPESRLLLKDAQLSDPNECRRMIDAFGAEGVVEDRLILMSRTPHFEHLAAFGRVDIALDPFPTTGGISTLEAMWMGAPVVAMLGNSIPSRVGAAIVSAAGLTDWVAANEDEYVAIAKRFATDPIGLAKLRATLRPSLATSPLGDSVQYCRAVEDAYRIMWRRWCQKTAPAQ